MSRSSSTLIALALTVCSMVAIGCTATRRASYAPRATGTPSVVRPELDAARVQVLLDSQPKRPFAVVGDLQVRTLSNPASIAAMQERAAREGLDGIYWIECTTTCSGVCSAKGFVFLDGASPWSGERPTVASR